MLGIVEPTHAINAMIICRIRDLKTGDERVVQVPSIKPINAAAGDTINYRIDVSDLLSQESIDGGLLNKMRQSADSDR